MSSFEESLEKLQTDYIDLFLIHWPNPVAFRDNWQTANAETWRAFEELYQAGKIKAIGVSNFLPHHFEELKKQRLSSQWSIKFSLHLASYKKKS